MILQRLVEYYDRLACATPGALAGPGYSVQKISFCVVLERDGTVGAFQSLLRTRPNQPRPRPQRLLVPGESKPGGGLHPRFLWDNSGYLLGYTPGDQRPRRTEARFAAFRDRHLAIEADIRSAAFSAVCLFLRCWSPAGAAAHAGALQPITGHFGVFRIAGEEQFVHEDPAVRTYWAGHASAEADGRRARCLVSGREEPLARLHEPRIQGVVGARSSGAVLVSSNGSAYESYGQTMGNHAPVGRISVLKYANSLNDLLARDDRRVSLGDATMIYWADRPTAMEVYFRAVFCGATPLPEQPSPVRTAKLKMAQVRRFLGRGAGGEGGVTTEQDDATRFYVLGLSPSGARISIRFWAQTAIGLLKARLLQHLNDLELDGAHTRDALPPVRLILRATARAEMDLSGQLERYAKKGVWPLLAGELVRAVLSGGPYPRLLLSAMIHRLRSDGAINHVRVATIRACLVRRARLEGKPKEIPVALDPRFTDAPYVAGRVLALLEQIQVNSDRGSPSTHKDRHFSEAIIRPGHVFPRLLEQSKHQLARMDLRLRSHFEKQLRAINRQLPVVPPQLNLDDQGLFAIGYFQQRRDLFTRKPDREGDPH